MTDNTHAQPVDLEGLKKAAQHALPARIGGDRPSETPGGCDCQLCGEVFVGDIMHTTCEGCEASEAYRRALTPEVALALIAEVEAARRPSPEVQVAEPFLRFAREVINPANGDRPWHADSRDWMVVFSFAGQSITLGDLRKAAALSPPEGASTTGLEAGEPS